MNVRPLQDRVLILPELPPETTESGLVLAEHRKPEQTGTVVAVGPVVHPLKADALHYAYELDTMGLWKGNNPDGVPRSKIIDEVSCLLRRLVAREPEVKVGDYVVFSWTAGQEIWVEHGEQRYLLMRESDILCVVEGIEA